MSIDNVEKYSKTVLITGGTRGIGKAISIMFAKKGYNVAVNYYKDDLSATNLIQELEGQHFSVKAYKCDVSSTADVNEMFKKIHNDYGYVNILVNNAGISSQKLFTDLTEEEWDNIFGVNVKGVFNCSRIAAKDMIKNHYGKIINISSMWGVTGGSCEVHYSATKGAIIAFTKALAKELGPSNINVNCVAPGYIDTDMNNYGKAVEEEFMDETPMQRLGIPEDIANTIEFLADDKSSFITGQILNVNGGYVI